MDEGGGGGVCGGGGESGGGTARSPAEGDGMTSFEVGCGRQRFTVELRPGETTIVSWKKLLKDARISKSSAIGTGTVAKPVSSSTFSQANNNHPVHSSSPPPSRPSFDPQYAPGQVGEKEGKDAPQQPSNRLNTVIERIERLYVGKASSDEEDLNDVIPDDDEYDTEDSFIDDTELDEYFKVDNSSIKHHGFFVNRGKLERVEPCLLPNEQPKKRRRKDLSKGHDGSDSVHNPNKHVRVGKKDGKSEALVRRNASGLIPSTALPNTNGEDGKIQDQTAAEIFLKRKYSDAKTVEQPNMGVVNGDVVAQEEFIDQQKTGALPAKSQNTKLKEVPEYSDTSYQRPHDKSSYAQSKSVSGKLLNTIGGLDQHVQEKEKFGTRERPEVSVADSKNPMQTMKIPHVQKKEGSSNRPKSTMLEKAIRDLEKMVAESRPPAAEVQDADTSSQAVKRRLPPEIKQKLAKVARLAQANHGKISKELISRLMSIVGHLIQLRTLKRNLKIMVTLGLSAKQEKDNRVQLVKKEVAEMVKTRIPFMKSKALEQQVGTSDDFEEISAKERESFKRKYSMDDALEDKICDLYDLYVEGLEEDAGPKVRKLYAELSALWPNGFMDNVGIKRAIYRAKERRRTSHVRHKESGKIKRKKILAQKAEDTVRAEANTPAQPMFLQEKLVPNSIDHGLAPVNKPVSCTVVGTGVRMPVSFMSGSDMDHPKQEKIKGRIASNSGDMRQTDMLLSKKRGKPETEQGGTQLRPVKLPMSQGDEKSKSQKLLVDGSLPKSNLQPPSFEQLS